MKIFNEIRPEEIESGFAQPEPGYEGFTLKSTDVYPGNFPRYQEPLPPESEIIGTQPNQGLPETSDSIIDVSNIEGNIWDNFGDESSEADNSAEVTEKDLDDLVLDNANNDVIEENIENSEMDNTSSDELVDLFTEPEASTTGTESSQVIIDEELKNLLQEELARSAEKKSKKETQPSEEYLITTGQEPKPTFKAVEETGAKVDFIDMMAIDPNLPKVELGSSETENPVEVIPQDKSKKKAKKEKIKPEKKEKGEKKPKSLLFWIFSSVASIIIIIVLSYFAFNYYIKSTNILHPIDTTLAQKDTINKANEQKKADEKAEEKTKPDTISKITENTIKDTVKPVITKSETKPKVVEEPPTPQKTLVEHSPKPNKITTPTEVHTQKVKVTKKTIQPKQEKKSNIASITTPTKPIETLPQATEKQIYTIQVYSTPSFEDAELWRQKLTAMKIGDVYISSQKIRDVVWYRVRFGKFSNRQQALDVAKQFGLNQTWVDRIQ